MSRRKLTDEEIAAFLEGIEGWNAEDGSLKKRFEFRNFAESLAFVNKVGKFSEEADHHPDVRFGWGYVEIELTTHDRNGLTALDFELAGKIDGIG